MREFTINASYETPRDILAEDPFAELTTIRKRIADTIRQWTDSAIRISATMTGAITELTITGTIEMPTENLVEELRAREMYAGDAPVSFFPVEDRS